MTPLLKSSPWYTLQLSSSVGCVFVCVRPFHFGGASKCVSVMADTFLLYETQETESRVVFDVVPSGAGRLRSG